MKIKNLKINGFGKIENFETSFSDGINIIKGENESGKSSLLKFIIAMFYGTSRNKNGKSISDYEKYKPWGTEDYSGKLEYELDNGKSYEIYREFKKKSPNIYDENKNDISKEFTIETTRGNLFFVEQTGVQEENFLASCVSEQENIRLSDNNKNNLIQKLGNIISSGNENASYRIAIDRLNRKQTTEIGNSRTTGRPINIIEKELEKYENERKQIEKYQDEKYKVDSHTETIKSEITDNNAILELLRQQKLNLEKKQIEEEKNKIFEQSLKKEKENKQQIEEKLDDIEEIKIDKRKNIKYSYIVCILILAIISAISIIINNKILLIANILPIISLIIIVLLNRKKKIENKAHNKKIYIEKARLEEELERLENEIENTEKELQKKKELVYKEQKENDNKIIKQYENKIDRQTIEDFLSTNYEKILEFIDEKEREQTDFKVKEKTIQIEKEQIIKKLDQLVELDEKIDSLKEQKEDLLKNSRVYDLVKEELEKSFQEIKDNITPDFINELKNIIKIVTRGKYKNVFLDGENNILIEIEDGQYMPIYMLSTGTIDLIYFALRISAAKEISKEKMPIILDESFAYYDENRMYESLNYLSNLQNRQIIIFTCSEREIEILERANIKYNLIEI